MRNRWYFYGWQMFKVFMSWQTTNVSKIFSEKVLASSQRNLNLLSARKISKDFMPIIFYFIMLLIIFIVKIKFPVMFGLNLEDFSI